MHLKKNNAKFLILFLLTLLFVIPWILASYVFHHHQNFHLVKNNHGNLLNPAIKLDLNKLKVLVPALAPSEHKWLLIYRNFGACDSSCQSELSTLYNMHLALAKDQTRVIRVLMLSQLPSESELNSLTEKFPGMKILYGNLEQNFEKNKILIVDPSQNCMITYPTVSLDPKGILKDLQKLLKLSGIG